MSDEMGITRAEFLKKCCSIAGITAFAVVTPALTPSTAAAARYTGADCRRCRREGIKLFLKGDKCYSDKCPVERHPYPPGQVK